MGDGGSSSDAGFDAPAGAKGYGAVVLLQTAGLGTVHSAGATFFKLAQTSSPCTNTTEGVCGVTECPDNTADAGAPALLSAGTVGLSGGVNKKIPNTGNNLYYFQGNGELWMGGEMISAAGTGDSMGAPAFALSLKAPQQPALTMPGFVGTLQVARNNPFQVKWTGAAASDVRVVLSSRGGMKTTTITCVVSGNTGGVTIPTSALAKLPVMGTGSLGVDGYATASSTSQGWDFAAIAAWTGKQGNSAAFVNVTTP